MSLRLVGPKIACGGTVAAVDVAPVPSGRITRNGDMADKLVVFATVVVSATIVPVFVDENDVQWDCEDQTLVYTTAGTKISVIDNIPGMRVGFKVTALGGGGSVAANVAYGKSAPV